jgi:branched-chain amino acid transport system ATP-binding protein
LNVSVLDNVLIGAMVRQGRIAMAKKEALRVIEFLGLGKYTQVLAHGLPLPLRKRLEMARALATRPDILLLDEVMAGLNSTEVDELIGLIREINRQGVTILMIEHVMRGVMALSQRVIVLNYGARIAEGTPREVVAHHGVIEAYLGKESAHALGHRS